MKCLFGGLFFAPISASARSVLLSLVWLQQGNLHPIYQELLCGFDKWLLSNSDRGSSKKVVERKNFEVIKTPEKKLVRVYTDLHKKQEEVDNLDALERFE